ncbi:DUF4221 family protein [Aquiflexum lacus]|uniref:DUF4221 family protein n=1 Tax=Aquiflexum lacus TaxID=2483805 RepID=UPI001893DA17|nr:DUF4221 family protein [Aquiflexum lacus]
MKKWLLGLTGIIVIACGDKETKESSNPYADFNISIDTVMVDSGNEILMAATNNYGHAISRDLKRLYNWDPNSSQIETVDLDEFGLLEKTAFEKEGPNGVGENAYVLRTFGKDQLAFIGWDDRIAITDLKGEVIQRIKLNEPWMTEGFDEKGQLSFMDFSDDGKKIYCGFLNFKKLDSDILELDLENQQRNILSLSEFAKRDKYRISWVSENGQSRSMTHPSLELIKWQDQILFFTNAVNSIYHYNPQQDTLVIHQYDQILTPNEKTGTYKNDVSSQEEMWEIGRQIGQEVNFTKLVWDDQNKVFYRFTYFTLPKVAEEETKYRSFISILSPDFELVGEKEITDLGIKMPNAQFVKDGKIYLFLNLDDELAYIRLQLN